MMKNNKLIVVLLFALITFSCSTKAAENTKPNVLIIVADDLGYADMSFLPYASKDIKTPMEALMLKKEKML